MSGKIIAIARRDAQRFISNGGFEVEIEISTPKSEKQAIIKGWGTLHHLSYDTDGSLIESKNAHVNITETELLKYDLPYRDEVGQISLRNWRVSYKDAGGILGRYVIIQNHPSQTLGCIVCILGDFENDR